MLKYLSLFIFFYLSSYSQDTIYFRSGQVTPAKVTEIGVSEIKYYKNSNSEGPLYTESKNEIKKIKYFGNRVDTFALTPVKVTSQVFVPVYQTVPKNHIEYRHGRYTFANGEGINPAMVLDMAESLATSKKIMDLKKVVYLARRDNNLKQITLPLGISCLGIGVGCLYGWLIYGGWGGYNSNNNLLVASPIFLAAGIPLMIMNGTYHKKYKNGVRRAAEMYNSNSAP